MAYFGGIFFANMGGGGGQNYFPFVLFGTFPILSEIFPICPGLVGDFPDWSFSSFSA